MSLLTRLSILLIVALSPALAFSVFTEVQARHSRERAVDEEALRLVHLVSASQQSIVEGARQMLTALAGFAAELGEDPRTCHRRLDEMLRRFGRYRALAIVAADGHLLCDAAQEPPDAAGPLRNAGSLLATVTAHDAFTVVPYDPSSPRHTQYFAEPYRDASGAIAGMVAAGLSLDWLQTQLDALTLPPGSVGAVIGGDFTVLARRPNSAAYVGKRAPAVNDSLIGGDRPAVAELTGLDGARRVVGYWPLHAGPTGFAVTVGLDRRSTFPDLAAVTRYEVELILLSAAAVVVLLLIGAERLIRRPVRELLAAAGRWQQGDLAARSGLIRDGSEFGRLGAAFDAMAAAREQRDQALREALEAAEQTRVQLVESETRLRLALSSADVAVWELDLLRRQVWLEDRAVALLGIDLPAQSWVSCESAGMAAWRASIHPNDAERRDAELGAIYQDRAAQMEAEYRVPHPAGGWRWIAERGAVVARHPATGRPLRVVGVARDVTAPHDTEAALERIVAERTAALRDSEARVRGVFDATFQYTFLLSTDGTLLEANQAALAFGGVAAADVLDRPLWETHWWEGDPTRVARLRRSVAMAAAGEFVRYEVEVRGADGSTALIDFSLKPICGPERQVVTLIAEGRDITERDRLQAQLSQAQKMEAVGQLTGGIAHDFNNMLQAITGNLDLISRLLEPHGDSGAIRVLRLVGNARRAAGRGAKLTQQLLAFSRKQNLRPERVLVSRLAADMGDLLRRAAGETVELHLRNAADLWQCQVDPAQFESALLNLVINARDAMPEGGMLDVSASNVVLTAAQAAALDAAPGDYVRVDVIDTGVGIAPELLPRIFEPFFTTKEVGKGSGLGLAMVHGFVRQSGGTVSLRSAPGRGTTVSMFLPRDIGDAADVGAEGAAGPRAPSAGSAAALSVLLVEDDADVLDAMQFALMDAGHRVFVARDGQEAAETLAAGAPIDLLVCDIVLAGGVSGIEVALRARERMPGLRVLFTTGGADDAGADLRALGDGCEVLRKPFSNASLSQHIAAIAAAPAAPPPQLLRAASD